jgi:hypothetical protein
MINQQRNLKIEEETVFQKKKEVVVLLRQNQKDLNQVVQIKKCKK